MKMPTTKYVVFYWPHNLKVPVFLQTRNTKTRILEHARIFNSYAEALQASNPWRGEKVAKVNVTMHLEGY